MAIDPQIGALLEQMGGTYSLAAGNDAVAARAQLKQLLVPMGQFGPQVEIGAVEDVEVDGGDGPLAARVYRPAGEGPHATLAFFHGGGFVLGDVESYEAQCRLLCHHGDAVVVSVEYRLAPEDPYPAAVEDAIAAAAWVADHAGELGGDPSRVAVGGDSAGGNLAAVVAQARRGTEPALCGQLLLYPVTDFATERPSHDENATGLMLTREDMEWFRDQYVPGGVPEDDPRVSPLLGDLEGLPPAVVATAGFDPLRDDGTAYAEALAAAGVPVEHLRFDTLIHGFFALGIVSAGAAEAVTAVGRATRELLAAPDA